MTIGNAIKEIRKRKGYSQKDFANLCDISPNALCQIEIDSTFPQKNTIAKLEIPQSYLLFFSLSEEDIPEHKREVFNALSSTIKNLLVSE
jgi:XRE family transcriptional regulator, regulator of sulfur utilization